MGMFLGTNRGDKENGHALTYCCMYIQMTNLWPRAVGLAVIGLEAHTRKMRCPIFPTVLTIMLTFPLQVFCNSPKNKTDTLKPSFSPFHEDAWNVEAFQKCLNGIIVMHRRGRIGCRVAWKSVHSSQSNPIRPIGPTQNSSAPSYTRQKSCLTSRAAPITISTTVSKPQPPFER